MSKNLYRAALAACLLAAWTGQAQAGIVKCKDSSGQITYTDNRCPPGTHPVDMPETASSETAASIKPDQHVRPLSPRASELKKKKDSCSWRRKVGTCSEYQELERFCTNRANWDASDCVALREIHASLAGDLDRAIARYDEADRKKCSEERDQEACESVACPASLMTEGTDSQVRACSRFKKLPSTSTWAQVREKFEGDDKRWVGDYYCLGRMVEMPNSIGQTAMMRPMVRLREKRKAGEPQPLYRVTSIHDETFATREEAIAAGCAAEAKKMRSAIR